VSIGVVAVEAPVGQDVQLSGVCSQVWQLLSHGSHVGGLPGFIYFVVGQKQRPLDIVAPVAEQVRHSHSAGPLQVAHLEWHWPQSFL
jgi:hypothetical protein